MNRWPLLVALLADPAAESRRLIAALSGLPARGRVYRPLDREARRPGPAGVPPGQRQILDVLADAPLKPFDIATRIGRTPGAIRASLGEMLRAGRVVRLPDGRYQCASHAREGSEDRRQACEIAPGAAIDPAVGSDPTGGGAIALQGRRAETAR